MTSFKKRIFIIEFLCGIMPLEGYFLSYKTVKDGIKMYNEAMKKEAERYGVPYEKMGRQLVWHDEFDKGAIDYDKWCFKPRFLHYRHFEL